MKKCPFCAEEIQDEAIKCKHCSEFLDGSRRSDHVPPPPLPAPPGSDLPWYFRKSSLIIMVLAVGPLALPLIWWHPTLAPKWKIAATAGLLLLGWLLWILTRRSLLMLNESLETLRQIGM